MSSITSSMRTENSLWDILPEDIVTKIFKYKIKFDFMYMHKYKFTNILFYNIQQDNNWVYNHSLELQKEYYKFYGQENHPCLSHDELEARTLNEQLDFTISKLQDKNNQDYLQGNLDFLQCNLNYLKYFKKYFKKIQKNKDIESYLNSYSYKEKIAQQNKERSQRKKERGQQKKDYYLKNKEKMIQEKKERYENNKKK